MYKIDDLANVTTCIDGKWVIAKPLHGGMLSRIKDAVKVLTGKAQAVYFYRQ